MSRSLQRTPRSRNRIRQCVVIQPVALRPLAQIAGVFGPPRHLARVDRSERQFAVRPRYPTISMTHAVRPWRECAHEATVLRGWSGCRRRVRLVDVDGRFEASVGRLNGNGDALIAGSFEVVESWPVAGQIG